MSILINFGNMLPRPPKMVFIAMILFSMMFVMNTCIRSCNRAIEENRTKKPEKSEKPVEKEKTPRREFRKVNPRSFADAVKLYKEEMTFADSLAYQEPVIGAMENLIFRIIVDNARSTKFNTKLWNSIDADRYEDDKDYQDSIHQNLIIYN